MERENAKKYKVTNAYFTYLQNAEADLQERIRAGDGTRTMRDALSVIQAILPRLEAEATPSDGDAA